MCSVAEMNFFKKDNFVITKIYCALLAFTSCDFV